jgi:hypothetical protein
MGEEAGTSTANARLADYKEKLLEAAILGLPLSLVSTASDRAKEELLTDPWKILWIVVPLACAAWLTLRIVRSTASKFDWRWSVFLGIYCSVFAFASSSDLLVWKRMPKGYYHEASGLGREWAVPLWLGDWRYWIVRRARASPYNIAVLLYDPVSGNTKERARLQDREAVELAKAGHAVGLAFDVTYEGKSAVDQLFCSAVKESGFTVLSTYDLTSVPGYLLPKRPPTKTDADLDCLQTDAQGHAMGLVDVDRVVRTIPLYWEDDTNAPALSVRIAKLMHAVHPDVPFSIPKGALLRFVPPADGIPVIQGADLGRLEESPLQLRNYFLIVGERSPLDTFETPFGLLSGALVHAYAAHSLLSGTYISRPPALWSAFIVFASCYVLTLLASRGVPALRLALGAVVLSAVTVALAAAAIYLWGIWLDVIYAVVATWILVPVLLGLRWTLARRSPVRGGTVISVQEPGPSYEARKRPS